MSNVKLAERSCMICNINDMRMKQGYPGYFVVVPFNKTYIYMIWSILTRVYRQGIRSLLALRGLPLRLF